jgi:hypothetical protein
MQNSYCSKNFSFFGKIFWTRRWTALRLPNLVGPRRLFYRISRGIRVARQGQLRPPCVRILIPKGLPGTVTG